MPSLPSGRRIEFSMDRFHAWLSGMDRQQACAIVASLDEPDDLLYVMDAVHFGLADGQPYFAGYVAADWKNCAADWPVTDQQAMQAWLISPEAREIRAEAVDYIRELYLNEGVRLTAYPYVVDGGLLYARMSSLPQRPQ